MKKISDFNSATEKYPVVYAGSASRPEYVDMPTILQQQEGVAPIDTLPAQWWNAMWKLATRDINAFRDFVGDAFTEINNLLTKFGITLDDADSEQLYDFFHDDYVQNYLSSALHSFFVYKSGDTIDGDLHIKGDLSVDGIGEEVISTELKVGANTITLRNENPSALGNTELAGIVTKNYDGNNHNNIIAINNNGEARTGDIDIATRILYSNDGTNFFTDEDLTIPATIGANEEVRYTGNQTSGGVEIYEGITYSNNDTEPLLTRAESTSLVNGNVLVWDSTNKRAIDGGTSIDSAISTEVTNRNAAIANSITGALKTMKVVECGSIPGFIDSWYVKYEGGIIEEWWVTSGIIPALSGSPVAHCDFVALFPIALKAGTVALQFDIYNQSVTTASAALWFGTSNANSDSNFSQAVSAFSFYPYPAQTGNVRLHVVGFWA